jgi:hypothetical protein
MMKITENKRANYKIKSHCILGNIYSILIYVPHFYLFYSPDISLFFPTFFL